MRRRAVTCDGPYHRNTWKRQRNMINHTFHLQSIVIFSLALLFDLSNISLVNGFITPPSTFRAYHRHHVLLDHQLYQSYQGKSSKLCISTSDTRRLFLKSISRLSMSASIDEETLKQNKTNSDSKLSEIIEDKPTLTANGGYTHTTASKAKISAANKGKIPWNKGKERSPEVKARIAEGVRRRNRERFLAKLADMGLTEEEYELQKKEERRKKDAERRARKTAKGGYTPTEETKAKISTILKEKWAKGEIKKRETTGVRRKGFKHSEETKQKIREALKKKWAEDKNYQEKMKNCSSQNRKPDMREKISSSLKEKWKDPEFREYMMEKFKKRRKPSGRLGESQRKKISETMKLKWQDDKYRNKALQGMEKYRKNMPPRLAVPKQSVPKNNSVGQSRNGVSSISAYAPQKKKTTRKKKKKTVVKDKDSTSSVNSSRKVTRSRTTPSKSSPVNAVQPIAKSVAKKKKRKKKAAKKLKDDGNIERLREERRDLFDLLYGDDPGFLDDRNDSENDIFMSTSASAAATTSKTRSGLGKLNGINGVNDLLGRKKARKKSPANFESLLGDRADLDDDDLDDFDPYGLEDF